MLNGFSTACTASSCWLVVIQFTGRKGAAVGSFRSKSASKAMPWYKLLALQEEEQTEQQAATKAAQKRAKCTRQKAAAQPAAAAASTATMPDAEPLDERQGGAVETTTPSGAAAPAEGAEAAEAASAAAGPAGARVAGGAARAAASPCQLSRNGCGAP